MRSPRRAILRSLIRGVPVVVATMVTTGVTVDLTSTLRRPAAPTFDAMLLAGAGWAFVVATAWAAVVCGAAVLEVATDGRLALTPYLGCRGPARRALLAAIGVVLAGGGALAGGPVSAAPTPLDHGKPGRPDPAGLGLPVPTRPSGSTYLLPRRHEVVPGDSLWRLSERRSPKATTAEVARLVERTYLANRHVIGPDPDLIRPGQRLTLPRSRRHAPAHPSREETP